MSVISSFSNSIQASVAKKENLFDHDRARYLVRSFYAGLYLTLGTMIAVAVGNMVYPFDPGIAKLLYSIFFSLGLVMIIFLNAELATSNMMYLTAGTFQGNIKFSKALHILIYCTIFNFIAAFVFAFLFSKTGAFMNVEQGHFLVGIVQGKLDKSYLQLFIEAILANILVNIAILGSLKIKNEMAKITFVMAVITSFVFLGLEHVIANFIYFPLAYFTNSDLYTNFSVSLVLIQYLIVFIGNFIGGGLMIGYEYAWLNRTESIYIDN